MNYPLSKLDNYFLTYNKINEATEYDIFNMNAKELFTEKRIDLVVKYYYIQCREKGENFEFAKELYEKHIEAFSDSTFAEQGNKNKNSIKKYLETFDSLIDAFKYNKINFDDIIIPVGKNNELLDGAHRTACAAYFNKQIKVVRFPSLSVDYGFKFFKRRLLDDFYLDFIAKEFALLREDFYVLFAWSSIAENSKIRIIEEILEKKQCKIIYRKKLKFNKEGLWNLIFQIYKDEHWIGYKKNNFKGITFKADLCYAQNGNVEVYILECPALEVLTKAKEEIRNFFGIGKSSIHTSDTSKETMEILNFILDKNYDKLLYDSFQEYRNSKYSTLKYIGRKLRYIYRVAINKIKRLLGKPV